MTSVQDDSGILPAGIASGMAVTGSANIPLTATDSEKSAKVGSYTYNASTNAAVCITMGSMWFKADSSNLKIEVEVINDKKDAAGNSVDGVVMQSSRNICSLPGLAIERIGWQGEDRDAASFNSDSLTSGANAIATWAKPLAWSIEGYSVDDPMKRFQIFGTFTLSVAP